MVIHIVIEGCIIGLRRPVGVGLRRRIEHAAVDFIKAGIQSHGEISDAPSVGMPPVARVFGGVFKAGQKGLLF